MDKFYYNSPIGSLKIIASENAVDQIQFLTRNFPSSIPKTNYGKKIKQELDQYFKGSRSKFTLKFKAEGTQFQKDVWNAMKKVKYSKTVSYQDIAKMVHRPKAVRAVGTACGRNPLPIVIPCHRIITSDGKLGGYGGGIKKKEWLLNHEKL